MSKARRTMSNLSNEVNQGLRAFAQEYIHQLKSTTPIATGRARGGWQNIYGGKPIGSGGKIPIAKNDVPYIGVLETGWSRQAPNGIVQPALQKTRKK